MSSHGVEDPQHLRFDPKAVAHGGDGAAVWVSPRQRGAGRYMSFAGESSEQFSLFARDTSAPNVPSLIAFLHTKQQASHALFTAGRNQTLHSVFFKQSMAKLYFFKA